MRVSRVILPALLLALTACGGSGDNPGAPDPPTDPGRTSHNAGRDCLQCHGFSLAGTVYRDDGSTYPGALVRITSQPEGAGNVLVSLTTDASGNFYTNQAVSWGGGLYTDVRGSTGGLRPMTEAVSSGACNSCHSAGDRIRAD